MTSIGKLKDRARKHEQKEDWQAAIGAYQKVLDKQEEAENLDLELGLFNRIGDLNLRIGQVDEAVAYYERAADKYAESGFYNNAIALCNKALRHRPDRAEIYLKLSRLCTEQGFQTDARRWILEYAERQMAAGEVEEALTGLAEFAELSDDPDVRELLAQQLSTHGRQGEALEQLRAAYAMRVRSGESDKAAVLATRAQEIDPSVDLTAQPGPEPEPGPPEEGPPAAGAGTEPEAGSEDVSISEGQTTAAEVAGETRETSALEGLETRTDSVEEAPAEGVEALESAPEPGAEDAGGAGDAPDVETGEAGQVSGLEVSASEQAADEAVEETGGSIGGLQTFDGAVAGAGAEEADMGAEGSQDFEDEEEVEPLPLLDAEAEPAEPEPAEPEDLEGVGPASEADAVAERDPEEPEAAEPEPVEGAVAEPEPVEAGPAPQEAAGVADATSEPESAEPEVAEPEASEPEVAEPEVAEPEVAEPEVAEPEAAEPEAAEPEAAEPEAAEPEVAEPAAAAAAGDVDLDTFDLGFETERERAPSVAVAELDVDAILSRAREQVNRGLADEALGELHVLSGSDAGAEVFRKALSVADEIARQDPDHVRALQHRVEYAARTGDRELIADRYIDLAEALKRQGAETKADAMYLRVLALDPSNEAARAALGETEDEEAIDFDAVLREMDPEQLGAAAIDTESDPNFAAMLSQFKAKVTKSAERSDAGDHYDLGLAFKEMGLIDEAITEFQTALQGGEERLKVYEELGRCFILKGQYNVALEVLDQALKVPDKAADELLGVYYHIGQCYEELGKREEARDAYEKVLAVDESFADVPDRVAQL